MEKKFLLRNFILIVVAAVIILFLAVSFIRHRVLMSIEESFDIPIGRQVEVNGHQMNVYSEGTGDATLVLMAGGGTCSPVLDFKSLYSLLSGQYRMVVVEKAGYGFSEDTNMARDVDTLLSETRQALALAEIPAPYVLCPHSMSGIEALYWAQQYPKEVLAIIGLDMAVPAAYKEMKINLPLFRLISIVSKAGLTRWFPSLSNSDAIRHGTLTENEKELYRSLFYRRTATNAMLREAEAIKASAEKVGNGDAVSVPVLMFASNGKGTGYDEKTWRGFQENYIKLLPHGQFIKLDCPHYVHDYEYHAISTEIAAFIEGSVKTD